MAAGEGWRVADVVCTCGPRDRPFEERQSGASISLVLSGTFVYRGKHGVSLLSAGSLMLVSPGNPSSARTPTARATAACPSSSTPGCSTGWPTTPALHARLSTAKAFPRCAPSRR